MGNPRIEPITVAELRKVLNDPRLDEDSYVFGGMFEDGCFSGITSATLVGGELHLDMHPECDETRELFEDFSW